PESTYKVKEEDKMELDNNQQQQINQLIEEYKDLFDISEF
ncbi:2157_t:CDS:1, partial [Ambispora gerdemannii]